MKKWTYIIIFGLTILSCKTSSKEKDVSISEPITEKLDSVNMPEKISKLTMTNSGSLEQSKDITINGVDFSIVQNKEGDTTFWATRDLNFKTLEGYSVGNQLKDISEFQKEGIYKELGFGYLIELNSGWQLGLCEGKSCTDKIPTENSTIKWIQKRK